MRIGLVTGEYPPMEGGVGAFTQELGKALHALGHEIHVISHRTSRPQSMARRAEDIDKPIDLPFGMLHPRIRKANWRDVTLIADLADRYELDVINIQYQAAAYNMRNPAINFAPFRLRGLVQTVVTFHDLRVPYLFPKAGRLREWVVQRMARTADGVIVTNSADFAQLAPQLDASRLQQIPIGSNIAVHAVEPARVSALRHAIGVSPHEQLLGYFGFLNPSKGADTLIDALTQLPSTVHLVFIGGQTGASDDKTNAGFRDVVQGQARAANVADRLHWTGFLADEEVSAWLRAADLLVLPYKDGVSLRRGTLMAGLAHGRPILSTPPQAPIPELVHGDNIWLAEANAVPHALKQLLANAALRETIGRNAAITAQQFDWQTIAERSATFFTTLSR